MRQFKKWGDHDFSFTQRFIATLLAGSIFALLIPCALVFLIPKADDVLDLSFPITGIAGLIIGCLFILIGLIFALWSISDQLLRARGTPLPIMPTQKLLVSGPFRYCRNPMSFGALTLYLGISIIVGSLSSLIVVIILSSLLILYLKLIEERELEARFGSEYLQYKKQTPFILPNLFSRNS